jgi:hypothetical protein
VSVWGAVAVEVAVELTAEEVVEMDELDDDDEEGEVFVVDELDDDEDEVEEDEVDVEMAELDDDVVVVVEEREIKL